MAMDEVGLDEMERQFDELLRAVEGGFEVVISQDGEPLAQLKVRPVDRIQDLLRGEAEPWYAVIIEQGENGYLATVPDLPPCIAAAESEEVVEDLIREVIRSHLEALRLEGIDRPEPTTRTVYVQAGGRDADRRRAGEQAQ